jgi:hypothetical protein
MNWSDITVNDYVELYEDLMSGDADLIISSLYQVSLTGLYDLPYEEVKFYHSDSAFIYTPIPTIYKDVLSLDGTEFKLIDFERLEFGAFIDLESMLSGVYVNNITKILSILYRRYEDIKFIGTKYEPYDAWLDTRASLFNDLPLTDVYGVLSHYIRFRESIFTRYTGLFGEKENYDEIDTSHMTRKEREELAKESKISKWGYELFLMKLANNEPLNVGKATELGLIEAMNILSMMQELQITPNN